MSITRWGCDDSDVYVYDTEEGFCCCGCFNTRTAMEMIQHLTDHIAKGHRMPGYAFDTLQQRKRDGL